MRTIICNSQVPFEYGGAEIQANALYEQLRQHGEEVSLVQIPQQWEPRAEILKGYMLWRLLDLTHTYNLLPVDRVICLKHPSYAVQHPRKITWLIHQLRQVYDLYGTPFGFVGNTEEERKICEAVTQMDTTTIGESKKIFAISHNVADRLWRYNGLRAEVLYPPIALEGQLHPGEYGHYVLSVSRLTPIKRVDLLIRAMALVRTPVRCVIVGTGEDTRRLHQLASRLHVTDRCQFLGFVETNKVIEAYANCLAVYYGPVDKDYGLATIEGFKSAKPVLTCTDSGGTLEFVTDGETGYVVDPTKPAELAQRLDELYTNAGLARRLGERGAEIVRDITWDTTISRLLDA